LFESRSGLGYSPEGDDQSLELSANDRGQPSLAAERTTVGWAEGPGVVSLFVWRPICWCGTVRCADSDCGNSTILELDMQHPSTQSRAPNSSGMPMNHFVGSSARSRRSGVRSCQYAARTS